MLTPQRVGLVVALLIVPTLGALVGSWALGRGAVPPVESASSPPGVIAEAGGLAVTYDPNQAGLTILVPGPPPAVTAITLRAAPAAWREVARIEPRALVAGRWEAGVPPVRQARGPAPVVRQEGDNITILLDGMPIGDAVRSDWSLTLSRTAPTLTLARTDTLLRPREVAATALAVTTGATLPHERLVLVNGTAYALAGGVGLDRLGNQGLSGLVHRDTALSFSLGGPDIARVRGERLADRDLLVLTTERPNGAGAATIQSSLRLQVGPRQPLQTASSTYNPSAEAFLLAAGYYGNVFVSERNGRVLTASMLTYNDSVWMRDVAMATAAYSAVLDDTATFRNTLAQFLKRTGADGVVPEYFNEAGQWENRQTWDAMPDLIHGVYAYVGKTRDTAFLTEQMETLTRVADWIRRLDSDGDGLPDQDIYPYGYFDSVENGVMHTYAIASFYAAMLEMAELNEVLGREGMAYRDYAERMRAAFNRPVEGGGYWQPERGYPMAWRKADGRAVYDFETFGVLLAVRVGLIVDEEKLRSVAAILRDRREEFLNHNAFPTRLMLGGYDLAHLRQGMRADQAWLLDANAPWLIGHDVAVRAQLGAADDAAYMLARYQDAAMQYPPMPEFSAAPGARHGAGESRDGGRLWDNAAWFDAVYATHYGFHMTPRALLVQPNPLRRQADDTAEGVTYQGMRVRLTLRPDGYTLTVLEANQARTIILQPLGRYKRVSVNHGQQQPSQTVLARPGDSFVVQCYGQ